MSQPNVDIHLVGERILTQWLALYRALGMHAAENDAVVRLGESLAEVLQEEIVRGRGRVLIVADSGCVFVHGDMLRLNRQGYARARTFVELLVAVEMNEIEILKGATPADLVAFTSAWRGAVSRTGEVGAWPVTGLPLRMRMVPSHIARDEAGRQHRGRILEEWTAFRALLRSWNADRDEGRVGPAVVARRVLQRLVDHEGRDPGYLLGIALFGPDGGERGARAALLAATLAIHAGMNRTVARGSGMAATYLSIGAPPVPPSEELDSWNAHYGLPAAQEWILRAGVERVRDGRGRAARLPVEVLLGGFAYALTGAFGSQTPRQALADAAACWPGAPDDPAFARLFAVLEDLLADGLPGALGTANGLPALRRAANEVVIRRPDGSLACVNTDGFVELDTAGPAPQAWYGFDAWPVEDDEPTFTAE